MPSSPLDGKHGRTMPGVACHHCHWVAQTVGRCQASMPSSSLASTHSQTTSGVACHHHLLEAHTVGRCWAWHVITVFGQHTWSDDIRRDMPSSPLDNAHGRTTSGMACHHRVWEAHTVQQRRAWHAIITFGQHKQSNDVRRNMKSVPLDCIDGWTTSGVA